MSFPERSDSSANTSALDGDTVKDRGYTENNQSERLKAAGEVDPDHASASNELEVQMEEQDKLLGSDGNRGKLNVSGQENTLIQGDEAAHFQEKLASPATDIVALGESPAPQVDRASMDSFHIDKLKEPVQPDGSPFSAQEHYKALATERSPLPLPPSNESLPMPRSTYEDITTPAASSRHPSDLEPVVKEPRDGGKSDEDDSQSEIQSILDQFDEKVVVSGSVEHDTIPSKSGLLPDPSSHPPRKSSLEPLGSGSPLHRNGPPDNIPAAAAAYFGQKTRSDHTPGQRRPSRMGSVHSLDYPGPGRVGSSSAIAPSSPISPASLHKSLPPVPDPEPDLPFDFHRFLEQLRHRTADPVAKFLRSFLIEFGKKQWMVHEQVKIIRDFLTFITGKMAQCEVWREVSDAEFDNAKEGMEKLVMNRLYSQTFSPAIPPPVPIPPAKGKRKTVERTLGPGRRGQHQEDIERDEVLAQKVRIYGWVREEHLDIKPVGDSGRRFLSLAQQELLKIKTYRAPRDKVICVLNCCKVIFGLLRNSKSADTSADSFVPLLILVVLQANPDHLVSNVQYILRFRNQDKLGGEAGYYLSSLMGAVQFIETLDRTALTVSDEEFEKHVEAAVSAIAERNKQEELLMHGTAQASEVSSVEPTPRSSVEIAKGSNGKLGSQSVDGTDEKAAVSGLLRTIQRPLSSIGRIFSEDAASTHSSGSLRAQELSAHPPETPRRLSPAVFQPPRSSTELRSSGEESRVRSPRYNAEDAAARQASAEAAEAHRIQRAEHDDVVETLASMFPDLDRDIIDDVVRMKEGRVGLAVEACLALNA